LFNAKLLRKGVIGAPVLVIMIGLVWILPYASSKYNYHRHVIQIISVCGNDVVYETIFLNQQQVRLVKSSLEA
jgi:hypothetical protein